MGIQVQVEENLNLGGGGILFQSTTHKVLHESKDNIPINQLEWQGGMISYTFEVFMVICSAVLQNQEYEKIG